MDFAKYGRAAASIQSIEVLLRIIYEQVIV